ncbi:MAG: hypothetical protein FJ100_04545 [Deltaproteobacteria bacterium]|nr:hypothetical protein [Deltaproteobacteria bacterium]
MQTAIPIEPAVQTEPCAQSAVRSPWWWLALAVLVLNDHVWKSGGVLPGAVTGKLSDIAGLVVTPAAVALLLRLRGTQGVGLAHALVGVWFAAINLSDGFAGAWSRGFAAVGVPWHGVVDAPDLWTLPALALSWWLHLPRRAAALPAYPVRWRVAGLVAAWPALVATEGQPPPNIRVPPVTSFASFNAALAIGNPGSKAVQLRIRPLRKGVLVDCAMVKNNPSAWLSRRLFGQAALWEVPPGANVNFTDSVAPATGCSLWLVDGNTMPMTLLLWDNTEFPAQFIAGNVGQQVGPASDSARVLRLQMDAKGKHSFAAHKVLAKAPTSFDAAPPPGCEVLNDGGGVAWSQPMPDLGKPWKILSLEAAPDGCNALQLASAVTGSTATTSWYLCLPPAAMPFTVDDVVTVNEAKLDHSFNPMAGVQVSNGKVAVSGGISGNVIYIGAGKAEVEAIGGCGAQFDKCGGAGLRAQVKVSGIAGMDGNTLKSGQSALVGKGRTLHVVRAQYRVTLDPACQTVPQGHEIGPLVESALVEVSP